MAAQGDGVPPGDFEALRSALQARQGTLSKRLAQVARFFLNHPEEVAIRTMVHLAEQAQVPPATITRFAKELGYAGFAELQAVFRERLLGPRPTYAERLPGPDVLADLDLEDPGLVFGGFVQSAIQSLLRIEETLDRESLTAVVAALADCEAVHVAAARGAFGVGAYTVFGLANIGKRAHLIDNLGAMRAEQVSAIGPRDAALVLTFDDYTPETVEVARTAAAAGRTVLAITDNELSPVAAIADRTLYVSEARLGHFRSQVPALVVCQSIIVGLARRIGAGRSVGEDFQKSENGNSIAGMTVPGQADGGEEP